MAMSQWSLVLDKLLTLPQIHNRIENETEIGQMNSLTEKLLPAAEMLKVKEDHHSNKIVIKS
jgi:hypothetical protein